MKISAAFAAVATVALAPLAAAQMMREVERFCTSSANEAFLGNLTATSTIKRTTVNGNSRVVQTIKVKNNGMTAAAGLNLLTTPFADLPLIKGRVAGVHSSPKPIVSYNSGTGVATSTVFTLPAGKQLKATFAYKAKACPALANPHVINTWVQIAADTNPYCYKALPPMSVRDGRTLLLLLSCPPCSSPSNPHPWTHSPCSLIIHR
jgi:hypothetical protein